MIPFSKTITYSIEDIGTAAEQFYTFAKDYPVWAFSGSLGAGKTTFTAAIAQLLQVEDSVSSPTFSLLNEYHYTEKGQEKCLYHCDWYRLNDEEEAINAGMEDIFMHTNTIVIVEWWEKAPFLLPKDTLYVTFGIADENIRILECSEEKFADKK